MNRMMTAPRTVFFSLQFVWSILFVLRRTVVATLTIAALQLNNFSHTLSVNRQDVKLFGALVVLLVEAHDRD